MSALNLNRERQGAQLFHDVAEDLIVGLRSRRMGFAGDLLNVRHRPVHREDLLISRFRRGRGRPDGVNPQAGEENHRHDRRGQGGNAASETRLLDVLQVRGALTM